MLACIKPLFIVAFFLLLQACATSIQPPFEEEIKAAGLQPQDVSVLMLPIAHQGKAQAFFENRPMAPASTLKLVTTAIALDDLGPGWRGETSLFIHASDLGQPSLSQPLVLQGLAATDFEYADLWFLFQQLYDSGVRDIGAGIVIDRSLFYPERPPRDSLPFDQTPRARYNHQPDALMLQQNMHLLTVSSEKQLHAAITPHWQRVQLDFSQIRLVDRACEQFSLHELGIATVQEADTVTLKLQGVFPKQCTRTLQLELFDRDVNLSLAIQAIWQQLGGTLARQELQFAPTPANYQQVAQYLSRPLSEVIFRVNKYSDNAISRILYAKLGQPTSGTERQNSQQSADQRVLQWFEHRGISSEGLIMDNGSGLSRSARISASQLAGVLEQAWHSPQAAEFTASLPLAGVDGSLRQVFRQGPAYQRARLKTGTLRDVSALAGYVWDKHGQPWIFVGFINHRDAVQKGFPLLERWVQRLAGQK